VRAAKRRVTNNIGETVERVGAATLLLRISENQQCFSDALFVAPALSIKPID
jgi:hypothetical protein